MACPSSALEMELETQRAESKLLLLSRMTCWVLGLHKAGLWGATGFGAHHAGLGAQWEGLQVYD